MIQILQQFLIATQPESLAFDSCGLNETRIQQLAECLPKLKRLKSLDLSNNPLTDQGCFKLFLALEQCRLERLLLPHCQVRNGAVRFLCDTNDTLKVLSFADNPGIGRESYQLILDTVQHEFRIQRFCLDNCGLNNQQLHNIYHFCTRNVISS